MPLNINFQQILLHLFNFVILFAVLYFVLYKPVREFMNKRTQAIENLRDSARKELEDAENIKAEYMKHIEALNEEIREIRSQAERDADELSKKKIAEAEERAQEIILEAHREGIAERNKIMRGAKNDIANLAEAMAEQVVTESVSDAYEQFLKNAERGNGNA
jgi:F-type H+-transporting ATPase subunit b